jgi:hypothetical protein
VVHAGDEREVPTQGIEELRFAAISHDKGHIEFCRFDTLRVLVELGAAGPTSDRDDLRMGQQGFFHHAPEGIGFGQGGAWERDGTDGQRAFVEVRQEGTAQEAGGDHRDAK